ncbi:MAG: Rrf2 family transcriptional regulator [Myxococcales bacterium]|nr:Rrf2 family transcriptional regulator [Myxococcales bacterium]MCB9531111.1 Rrf2 family transcriptional regulator [Myxococcales bacterium]MCB9533021.1 Rrf2 family transcriptional regulator [Myxococcales bacterium]
MLQIPRRVEYALRAIVALARAGDAGRLSFKDIAEREDIPRDYLAKILKELVDAELIESRRGANGGYSLARPADDISFLAVIEAADSPVAVNHCTENGVGCDQATDCAIAGVWQAAEDAMRTVFARTSVGAMLHRPLDLGRLTTPPPTAAPAPGPCGCPCVRS